MLSKNKPFKIIKILLIIICILYLTFLYMDFFNIKALISSNRIKIISIILCFIISLLGKEYGLGVNDVFLLRLGLFITIIADLFLLVLDSHFILGVFLFSIVQIIYIIRYDNKNIYLKFKKFTALLLILIFMYGIINSFIVKIDFLIVIGFYYAITLLTSFIKSIKACKYKIYPSPNRYMIVMAMILFLLCDINVFLYNLIDFIPLSAQAGKTIYNISSISMWLFYLPSQVLLSLSGYKFPITKT